MNENSAGAWIQNLQANGRYSFLRQELVTATGLSAEAVKKALQRLAKRQRVAKVNDYFYTIVPTEYLNAGSPPASWFVDHLMEAMKRPYYIGLLSAASLHGASHHQPQEFQVITNASVRLMKVARQQIHFFKKRHMQATPTVNVKTPTGMIRVSSPEGTALDLVHFAKAVGQLGNVATVLNDLAEKLKPDLLIEAAEKQDAVPSLQRLGYLLELVNAQDIAGPIAIWLKQRSPRTVPLRPDLPKNTGERNATWKLLINDTVEVDT